MTSSAPVSRDTKPYKRRLVPIVDARFQWKYTLIITAIGVGITCVMGMMLYRAYADNARLLELEGDLVMQQQVMRGNQLFFLYLVVLIVAMAFALVLFGLVITHRVSGPLYVMARYLGEIVEGRYPDLRPLRKHDELRAFFSTFEQTVGALRARDGAALRDLDLVIAKAGRARQNAAELEGAVAELERLRASFAARLG